MASVYLGTMVSFTPIPRHLRNVGIRWQSGHWSKGKLGMDYEDRFRQHLEVLHREGRYRVFADLKRRCGAYPTRNHFADGGTREVTVWCSNDFLGMSQHRAKL